MKNEQRIMGVRFVGGTKLGAEKCVVLGLSDKKNNVSLDNILDLRGMKNLLVVDIDYFLEFFTDVTLTVKAMKNRYKLRNKEKPWWEDNPIYMNGKELKRKMKSVEGGVLGERPDLTNA